MDGFLFSKTRLLFIVGTVVFLSLSQFDSDAQTTPPTSTTVDYIRFVNFKSPIYSGDYRWLFYTGSPGTDFICEKQKGVKDQNYTFSTDILTNVGKSITEDIGMYVEAWQEDSHYGCSWVNDCGQGDCKYNDGCHCADDKHCELGAGDRTFQLQNYEPGLEDTVTVKYCYNKITYAFRYRPPAPIVTGVTYGGKDGTDNVYSAAVNSTVCANNTIRVAVTSALSDKYHDVIQYYWEYNIGNEQEKYWVPNPEYCGSSSACKGAALAGVSTTGKKTKHGGVSPSQAQPGTPPPPCCYVSEGSWEYRTKWTTSGTTYVNTDNGALKLDLLSIPSIANLTHNSFIQFRITTVAHGYHSTDEGSKTIYISPRAPELGLVEPLQSCPNSSTGSIKVSGIKGSGKYQCTIRTGLNNNKECTPIDGCLNGIKSDTITTDAAVITPVAGGNYTLWISNYGGTYGMCSSTVNVTIPVIPLLSITQVEPKKDATCNGYADGVIKLAYSGGVAPYTFSLTGNPSNTTGVFSGLKANTYTASVTDGCSQVNDNTSLPITITEPKSIKATVVGSTLTCNSPADGTIVTTITDGPGTYNYYLKQGTSTLTKVENTGIVSWNVSNKPAGSYAVEIIDAQRPACPGFSSTVNLTAPPVLTISSANIQVTNVSCNDGSDGKVTLASMDMSGKYNYILTRSDNTVYTTSTATDIANLRGADYKLAMMRTVKGCNDIYTYPSTITVTQPSPITIGLSKQDISCYGLTDGKITSTVTGGTGPNYSYTWEQSINSSWSTLASTISSVSSRAAGTYRVRVKDAHNCLAVSDPKDIIEPSKLSITNASVQDIKCFGEKGFITVNSEGGTGTVIYQYSLGGSSFTTFTTSTPLSAGSYTVHAMDNNKCTTPYRSTLPITTPASALNFTYTKSDYNGVNISCFNGSNGYITLVPSGGNGGSFSGYTYGIDTNPYQASEKIEGVNAGNHTFSIKDGRGCIKSQTVNFTQSTDKLTLNLVSKKDVACFGDQTGALEVTGKGGVSPYGYNIDAGTDQSTGKFTGLGAGVHTIQLTDKNNCAGAFDFQIASLNPRIEISSVVSDVKCFAGSDGKITVSVSGGVAPFTYAWSGQSSVNTELSGIKSGEYELTVTDNAGCKMGDKMNVSQPAQALKISVATVPVCYGMTNGLITITPTGGTIPYLYSVDNGSTYQSSEVFNTVGVGSYAIKVKDYNECSTTASANIVQRNDKPEPDFIVATKESALDTLVITEISVPKPDSIEWIFDEHAIVLDNNTWQPKIKFEETGNYSVGMKGYFGGCVYLVTRSLTINPYDPQSAKTKLPEYKAINSVSVTPNPNSGEFTVTVKLNYKHSLSMVVYDIIGGKHYHGSWDDVEGLTETITMNNVASGVYLLRVITPTDTEDVRILISK